jgi:hypothetical protein
MIRIANGQGFWGDWLEAPKQLVDARGLDYLTLDYLAEVTMSILQKAKKADANLGYARDFPPLIQAIAPKILDRGIRVVANAGGVNPIACAKAIKKLAPSLKIAVVLGDDILDRIDALICEGQLLRNMDTGESIETLRSNILSANVYLGAFPIAEALATGADVVITGRCADAALALGPMIHRFGWRDSDYDLLSAGTVGGHVIECGTQATGGNCQADWRTTPDFAHIGYPILEAHSDGRMIVTKPEGTGGRVTLATVKEQLVYEIGDPTRYITPDVVVDFTALQLRQADADRVEITGSRGAARPDSLKVSISYHYGWKAIGTLVYSAPEALEKAKIADAVVRERLAGLNLRFEKIHTEFFGVNACHAHLTPAVNEPAEVQLRVGVRDSNKAAVERFTRELIPLVLSGPPGATGYGEGRPQVREIVAYWPALVPRETVHPRVEVVD